MYKEFFNLSAEPFRVTPDPGFLFLTDQHKEALAAIIYGIAKRKGFVCITGEVGVGKTTILKSYLDSVDEPGLRFVYIYNPNVSFHALLRHIFKELGVQPGADDLPGMVEALHAWLLERHKRRETLVLLIDEAQNMPIGTLENLRLLSNLETSTEKLVQIVLVGQPELEAQLAERQLRQVESRIAVRTRLGPLSRKDSVAYIRHRLKLVALDDQPVFEPAAMELVARRARGIPRRINVICDTALMNACGHKVKPVTAKVVREVLHDLRVKDGGSAWGAGLRDGVGEVLRPFAARAAVLAAGTVAAAGLVWAAAAWLQDAMVENLPPVRLEASLPQQPPLPPKAPPMPAEPAPALAPSLAPVPAAVPAAVEIGPASSPAASKVLRIVAPGDTLTALATQVYGKGDRPYLDWVKAHNPDIVDINRLQVGQIIEFPAFTPGN
jgi:general secretion pathway protein A